MATPSTSLCHKRSSQVTGGETVLDGEVVSVAFSTATDDPGLHAFRGALGISMLLDSRERLDARVDALRTCAQTEQEIAVLRASAAKEVQLARQVDLNLKISEARKALSKAITAR